MSIFFPFQDYGICILSAFLVWSIFVAIPSQILKLVKLAYKTTKNNLETKS